MSVAIVDYDWVPQDCPICEKSPARFLGRRGGQAHRSNAGVEARIWQCRSCGLIFPNPMSIPVGGLDQHYSIDPDDYFKTHQLEAQAQSAARILDQASQVSHRIGTLLDIGCGRGQNLSEAVARGWQCVGLEPSPTFAAYAASHTRALIEQRRFDECRFESETFDVVLLAGVLEHLYNPVEVVKEIARILRPGGALYLDVPNEQSLYCRVGNLYHRARGLAWAVNISPTFSPFHVFGFGPKSLRRLLESNGLEIRQWGVSSGVCCLPDNGCALGRLERWAALIIHKLSAHLEMGTLYQHLGRKVVRPAVEMSFPHGGRQSRRKCSNLVHRLWPAESCCHVY